MSRIIAFSGHIGSGKTESASIISNLLIKKGFSVAKIHFSEYLKKLVSKYLDIQKDGIMEEKYVDSPDEFKKSFFNMIEEILNKEYCNSKYDLLHYLKILNWKYVYLLYLKNNSRRILQYVGTDIVRDKIDDMFWIKDVLYKINLLKDIVEYIIIDDVRFLNEFNEIRKIQPSNVIYLHCDNEVCAKRKNKDLSLYLEDIEKEPELELIRNQKGTIIIENNYDTLKELYNFWRVFLQKIV